MKNKILALLIVSTCTVQAEEISSANQQEFLLQQKLLKTVRQQLTNTRKEVTRLQKSIATQRSESRQSLAKLNESFEQRLNEQNALLIQLNDELKTHTEKIEQLGITDSKNEVKAQQLVNRVNSSNANFTQLITSRSLWAVIGAGAFLIMLIGITFYNHRSIKFIKNSSTEAFENTMTRLNEIEESRIDGEMKWVESLNEIVESYKNMTSSIQPVVQPNHQLPIKVADEIFRMRKRLAALPEETKGLKPLNKSLERLESELDDMGYEIVDHTAMAYNENMAVNSKIIASDLISTGCSIITKVISPQINYQGTLNRMANVEVSVG